MRPKRAVKKLVLNACTLALGAASAVAHAADKPNILVIFGDDVGYWNLSTYKPRHDGVQHAKHR